MFQGRPFVFGRNRERSLFVEIWDRRQQTWNATSIFANPITAISRIVTTAIGCQALVQSTQGQWMWLSINFFEGTVEHLKFPNIDDVHAQMLSDDGLWIVYDNMVSKLSPDSERTSWTLELTGNHYLAPYEAQQIVVISSNSNETQVQIKDKKTGQDRGKPWISYSNDPIKTTILPDGRLWICTPKSSASIFI